MIAFSRFLSKASRGRGPAPQFLAFYSSPEAHALGPPSLSASWLYNSANKQLLGPLCLPLPSSGLWSITVNTLEKGFPSYIYDFHPSFRIPTKSPTLILVIPVSLRFSQNSNNGEE